MIENKLAALGYHEFFADEGRYIKMINHLAVFIIIDKSDHVLCGYVAADDYISEQKDIDNIQIAYNQLQNDLKELRGW
jgi:hypothetical protein